MNDMNITSTKLFSPENFQTLKSLVRSFPNDFELGREVRKAFKNDSFVKAIGMANDQTLGKEIRKNVVNFSN